MNRGFFVVPGGGAGSTFINQGFFVQSFSSTFLTIGITQNILYQISTSLGTGFVLPNGMSVPIGSFFIFKDQLGLAPVNNIFISGASCTIDGNATYTQNIQYSAICVYNQGTNWGLW